MIHPTLKSKFLILGCVSEAYQMPPILLPPSMNAKNGGS
jgi:hypothetical protein